jgi:crossover junction endodeoxyribonuclease RuvC
MLVLGVDPGCQRIGLAIVKGNGKDEVVETEAIWNFCFTRIISAVLTTHPFDLVACEGVKSYRMSYDRGVAWTRSIITSLTRTSLAIGQLMMACHIYNIPMATYPKDDINRFIHGSSRCSKRDLQEAVRLRLGLSKVIRPAHCNDAVAVALYAMDQWKRDSLCERAVAGEHRLVLQ